MKSRSELMAERKAATKSEKSSASSRTLPIPGTEDEKVHCSDCDTDMSVKDLKKRVDGSYECSTCSMPLTPGVVASGKVAASSAPLETVLAGKKSEPKKVETRSGSFCGKCGAEWPLMDGKFVINCGHATAVRVDDPRKADNMAGSSASGVANPPAGPPTSHAIPSNVTVAFDGNRMSVTWGKVIFPVGEALGVSKFSNMDIGPFSITETFDPSTFVETYRRILANLQKIADMTFDVQFVWYKQKLGILDK